MTPRGDPGLIPFRRPPRGHLHTPADPVQQQIHPRQRVLHAELAVHYPGDPGQRPTLVLAPAVHGRPSAQQRRQLPQLRGGQLAPRPGRAPRRQRGPAPAASARRHRFAGIRDTWKCRVTSRSLAPASISSAAASRTCSRQARSARHHRGT